MIDLGDQVEGLYRLVLDFFIFPLSIKFYVNHVSTNNNLTIPYFALWHFRLGYVSHKRLSHVPQLYLNLTFYNHATLWHLSLC